MFYNFRSRLVSHCLTVSVNRINLSIFFPHMSLYVYDAGTSGKQAFEEHAPRLDSHYYRFNHWLVGWWFWA